MGGITVKCKQRRICVGTYAPVVHKAMHIAGDSGRKNIPTVKKKQNTSFTKYWLTFICRRDDMVMVSRP